MSHEAPKDNNEDLDKKSSPETEGNLTPEEIKEKVKAAQELAKKDTEESKKERAAILDELKKRGAADAVKEIEKKEKKETHEGRHGHGSVEKPSFWRTAKKKTKFGSLVIGGGFFGVIFGPLMKGILDSIPKLGGGGGGGGHKSSGGGHAGGHGGGGGGHH